MTEIIIAISSLIIGFVLSQVQHHFTEKRTDRRILEEQILSFRETSYFMSIDITDYRNAYNALMEVLNATTRISLYIRIFEKKVRAIEEINNLYNQLTKKETQALIGIRRGAKFYNDDLRKLIVECRDGYNMLTQKIIKEVVNKIK